MDTENHELIFKFLYEKFRTQESFGKDELRSAVPDLKPGTMDTYWSKWIRNFLTELGGRKFRVAEKFRPYSTWEKFSPICTQVRKTHQNYTEYLYDSVIIYDFLMPLNNESHLRTTLDALFYKDTVLARLRAIGDDNVRKNLPEDELNSQDDILEQASRWVAEHFRGYSITHVNGRFRAENLCTLADAARFLEEGRQYLIDETTAVVRFIFHCGVPKVRRVRDQETALFDAKPLNFLENDAIWKQYHSISWFFRVLFVENILQVVNGEDEIWMVESGFCNRLHRWAVE